LNRNYYPMKKIITIICASFLFPFCAFPSVKTVGFAFTQNYPKETYKAGTQTWSIAQDQEGVMYFGNNAGLLAFDGSSWRTYLIPNRSIVRSVLISGDGRIYVGASNDFGYFYANQQGQLVYHSLLYKIPEEYRDFGEVWKIVPYLGGYIFHSFNAVFFFKDDKIDLICFNRVFHFSFAVEGNFYVREISKGLLKLTGLNFTSVKNSEQFGNITVMSILQYDENTLLVATREKGIFLVNDSGISRFGNELQSYFEENQIFSATNIGEEYLAFGTVQDGIVILDRKGSLVQRINRERGLQNNTVLCLFADKQNNLWLGLDNGIDYVQLNSPLSYFAHQNIVGAVYAIEKKGDDLYLGTNQGLFKTKWPPPDGLTDERRIFQFVDGLQGQVWMLSNRRNSILIGHDKGTYTIDSDQFRQISNFQGGWSFAEFPGKPQYLIEGTYAGILLYEYEQINGKPGWKFIRRIPGFYQSCKQIQFDEKGYLWIGHSFKGIYRLKINATLDSITEIRNYATESGLPGKYNLNVLRFYDKLIVSADGSIYTYNYKNETFYRDEELSVLFNNGNVYNLIEDFNGDCWFFTSDEMGILKPNFDGSYHKIYLPFLPLRNKLITSYEHVYPIDKSNILISTEAGVIHFDPTFQKTYDENYIVKIRRVEILPDSILFDGHSLPGNSSSIPEFTYRDNALRFTYSALFYEMPGNTEYSIVLEGYDKTWSEWSQVREKEYTNLHEGSYRFRVKTRNIYGTVSEAQSYDFIILPPWYRSKLAYVLYTILFISAIAVIILFVIKKIEKEKHALKEKQKVTLKEKEKVYTEEVLKAEQEIIQLRNEKLEAENQKNLTELDSKTRELASIAMQITYKNEMLNQVKQKLIRVSGKMLHRESKQQVSDLIKTLEKDLLNREDWEKFEIHFDQVHEDFLKKIRKKYPELTPKDLRLCAYLKMNLSSKEIAPILNISVRGVEISRYRLRKKMDLPRDTNLNDFMMNL